MPLTVPSPGNDPIRYQHGQKGETEQDPQPIPAITATDNSFKPNPAIQNQDAVSRTMDVKLNEQSVTMNSAPCSLSQCNPTCNTCPYSMLRDIHECLNNEVETMLHEPTSTCPGDTAIPRGDKPHSTCNKRKQPASGDKHLQEAFLHGDQTISRMSETHPPQGAANNGKEYEQTAHQPTAEMLPCERAAIQTASQETLAIATALREAKQSIAIEAPPTNGGVPGFETKKKRKMMPEVHADRQHTKPPDPAQPSGPVNTSMQQQHENHDADIPHEQPNMKDLTANEAGQDKGDDQKMTSEPQTSPETQSPKARQLINSGTAPQDKIQVWIITNNKLEPTEIHATPGTTPGQLTQAEANLGSMVQPIFPRTWVGTPIPLYEPVVDKQVVYLQQFPQDHRCPVLAGQISRPDIPLGTCRIHILWKQLAWVAQDEMWFYLQTSVGQEIAHPFMPEVYHDEAAANEEAGVWLHRMYLAAADLPVVSAAIVQGHWIPIILTRRASVVTIETTPEGTCFLRAAQEITNDLHLTLEVKQKVLPQEFAADCGFQTLAWLLANLLGCPAVPMSAMKAEQWRYLFAEHLLHTRHHVDIIHHIHLGGMKQDDEMIQDLSKLLEEHGVFHDRSFDRATKIAERMTPGNLSSILTSRKPWPDLKQAANQMKPPMKLIMQDELEAQIRARSRHRTQFGRKPAKTSHRPYEHSKEALMLTAAELQVPEGVFKQHDGTILGPLRADQVGPHAEGVVLVDEEDSHAVLKLPTPVTQKGLAVLVLATKENANVHEADPIRFPALCVTTQEPLIAAGYLYQLGVQEVQRFEPSVKLAVDERQTEAIRCLVFQDQSNLWDEMQNHPVRSVFAAEPLLQQKDQGVPQVIDVWDRQWVTKRFEKTKNKTAEIFAFSFRMLAEKAEELIVKSGTNGVYYEPRSACGGFPSSAHHVTWIPNATYQEAKYAQQTSPQATSLVRHANRYGLRSDTLNAQEIHAKHRPDTPLLLGATKKLYALGPLPYSTTKDAVTKLLKAWGWEARPLQPRGRSQDGSGVTWTIQATADPSHWIYVLQHGDVLVSKLQEERPVDANPTYSIVASRKTIQHLHNNADQDPWLTNDPWKPQQKSKAKPAQPAQSQYANLHPAALATMEANLEKKLLANIGPKIASSDQDVAMEPTAIEARVTQLESQLNMVRSNQSAIEQKVVHVDQSLSKVQMSQHGLEQQVGTMQSQLEQQGHHIAQTLEQKMAEQMDRIEALFSKRVRHE